MLASRLIYLPVTIFYRCTYNHLLETNTLEPWLNNTFLSFSLAHPLLCWKEIIGHSKLK